MEIKYLVDHPEHIETVGMWVFKEFKDLLISGGTKQHPQRGYKIYLKDEHIPLKKCKKAYVYELLIKFDFNKNSSMVSY